MSDLIDVLLVESELNDDHLLRELLGEIEREATAVRPLPSAALVELMSQGSVAPARRVTRRSSLTGHRAIITGIAVIGVLGLGAGAAAASPEVRSTIGAGVAVIAHFFQPANAPKAPFPTGRDDASPGPGSSAAPTAVPTAVPTTQPIPEATHGPAAVDDSSSTGGATGGAGSSGTSDSAGSSSNSGSGSNSGSNSGSSGHSGDTHGNGKGNQSGHGNGKGQGNGGPAPTP